MPMDNVTLENTQQSISSRDAKSVASVMVNGKWINLSDTLEQANVKSDVGTVAKQVAAQQEVVSNAVSVADSAVAYANDAIEKSRVNSQAIDDINSAVSDAASDAAVARSDGLRAWNAAQSSVNLIDLNYASASASISSARTEAIAAADEAKASASAAKADIVAVRSGVAAVQADVTATRSDVAVAKSDIADTKTSLTSQAKGLSSYAAQASAAGKDITTLKSQAGQLEQDMADTKGDVSQLMVSASSASITLSDAAGNISRLQATAKSYSAALSDTNSNVASVTATARELETKYADAAGDINKLQTDAKGTTQTLTDAQGDIAKLKIRADGFDTEFADTKGNINKIQTDATGTMQTLANTKSDVAVLQSRADGLDAKYADAAGNINTLKVNASGFSQTLVSAKGDISTLKATATGFKNTLTDAQGNISTLQSDVSGLKKTTSDNAGNIATLQASAKTLTSQMSDAQGNISTLQQTASGFSSKVSGMETSLANANGKINDITSNGGGRNLLRNSNVELYGKAYGFGSVTLTVDHLEPGETYTMSWYGKVDANATKHKQPLQVYIYNDSWSWCAVGTIPYTANEYQRNVFTFTVPNNVTDANRVSFYLKHYNDDNSQYQHDNDSDAGIGYVKDYMLEKGTVAHDWSPAPEDIDTKITTNTTAIEQNKKAITLKADQATVDKTNGTVQQLQSQLKVQADQIASKVSSSDLNAKGYATQTYTQTQIKQTSDSWNANLASVKNGLTKSYTNLHATVDGIQAQVYNSDGSSKITQLSNLIATKVSSSDFNNLSKSVNLQTLDSADINNMRTNGHYFVHNLANNPIGGWVYVDVTGNGNDRIRQDVYQDSGIKHKYRRLYGPSWTGWEEGATESEITQLSDAINLRVTKGDVISQINEEAGGNTLIQVSNGNGSLILDAANTIVKGKEWIPVAAIADLTADQIQAGTLKGVKVDFRDSTGTGMIADGSTLTFDVSNTPAGYLSYNGMPVAELPDGSGGNELAIRYGLSTAIVPDDNSGAQATFSKAAQKIAYMTGTSRGKKMLSGLEVHSNNHHWLCAVNSDATCNRFEVNDRDGLNIAWHDQTHFFISDGNAKLYKDNDDSPTATKLEVHGWAWVNGWVEAAGHSQHSALSTKTDIQPVDDDKMLEMVNDTDLTTFLYKTDVASGETHRHIGLIIDDVHDVAQYQAPQDFIAPNGVSRDDDNMIGALFGAVKALTKRITTLESKVG